MNLPFTSSKICGRALASLLVLWFAGAGCLLGCASSAYGASSANEHVVGASVAPVTGHSCCKAHLVSVARSESISNAKTLAALPEADVTNCCQLAGTALAPASKVRSADTHDSAPISHAALLGFDSEARAVPIFHPPRLPDRGRSYLQHCVFLT